MSPARVTPAPAPAGLAAPVGHYSHATIGGGLIFVSGLLALDRAGALVGAGDAGVQAAFIFETLDVILAAAGAGLADVAKLSLYLVDLADRGAVNAARREAFGAVKPASTLVQVAGLIGEGTLVEIEAIAVLPSEPPRGKDA